MMFDGSALWTLTAWLGALSGPSKYREREERRSKTHFVEEVRRTASLDTFRLVWANPSLSSAAETLTFWAGLTRILFTYVPGTTQKAAK